MLLDEWWDDDEGSDDARVTVDGPNKHHGRGINH